MTTTFGLNPDTRLQKALHYFVVVLGAAIVLGPLFIVVNVSLKSDVDYTENGPYALPESLYLENYEEVLTGGDLLLSFRNTLFLVVTTVAVSVLIGAATAYVIGRFRFPLRRLIMFMFIFAMIVPGMVTEVARFLVVRNLGLFNTIWSGVILMSTANVVQLYIFLQFIEKIPRDLDDNALIDGASYFWIFFRLILPLMRPAIATVVVLKSIEVYNNVLVPYIYMPNRSLSVVSTGLMRFSVDRGTDWNLMSAGVIAIMIPTLILFLALQRHVISGLTSGAVKY